jgi:hypothetical protein
MDSYGLVHFVQSNFVDVFYHVLTNYWIWAGFLNTIGMGGQQTQQGTGLKSLANRGLNHQNCVILIRKKKGFKSCCESMLNPVAMV